MRGTPERELIMDHHVAHTLITLCLPVTAPLGSDTSQKPLTHLAFKYHFYLQIGSYACINKVHRASMLLASSNKPTKKKVDQV